MKKVNLFIQTLSTGGAERVVSNIAINLESNIKKTILLYGEDSKTTYPYDGELIYLDRSKSNNEYDKIRELISRINAIKKVKKQDKDTTTISFLEYPNLINSLTTKHGKSIISVRNHMSTKHKSGLKARFWNATIKYLYPKADLTVAVSEEIKSDLIDNYKIDANKIKVIYNSYDIDSIQQMAEENIETKYQEIFNNPVIITAGRLNKQKGHWHLIRAFAKVKETIPNAQLVLLGEGELEGYLKQLAAELNILDSTHFLGFQKNPFKFISRSQLFAMSSFHEGFPNALAEAMACGVPVVSSDCLSGPREILAPDEFKIDKIKYGINENRYGVLVPVCDGNKYGVDDPITNEENEMSKALIQLLKDEEKRDYFSRQSLKRIKDFEISNIIKEWESII